MRIFLAIVSLCAALGAAAAQPAAPLQTIATLDVQRYSGRWFEVAKFPNRFQKKCVSDTVAQYQPLADGRVQVTNQCRLASGQTDQAIGMARQMGEADSPRLQVRFAPAWLSVLPWVWGDYWVIDLDPEYRLAAVSEPSRNYLWILSREPSVDPARYAALLQRLSAQGLDIGRLELSVHSTR